MAKKKGGKKKKKTKAQEEAERLQREEEERIAREEREERERQERIELERRLEQQRLERKRLRKEELQRLSEEASDAAAVVQRLERAREQWLAGVREAKQWRTYVESTCRPDPRVQSEVASMLEEWQQEPHEDLAQVLAHCEEVELCARDIQELVGDLRQQCGEHTEVTELRQVVRRLRVEERKKIDRASAHVLVHRHKFVTPKAEVLVGACSSEHRVGLWMNAGAKAARVKAIEFPSGDIRVEIQKAIATQPVAVRALFTAYDNVSYLSSCDTPELPELLPVGGVLCVELLRLPAASKEIKHWTITPFDETLHDGVQRIKYPADGEAPDSVAPVTVKYALDRRAVVCEPVRVAWWDDVDQEWSEEDIYDIRFDAEQRTVQFQTTHLTALAVVQPPTLELPYKGWHIQPAGQEAILYTLKTARFTLRFRVDIEGKCALLKPALPELASFLETPMELTLLFEKLAAAGINVQPGPEFAGHATGMKDTDLEERAYKELSYICAAFSVRSDPRNASLGAQKCVANIAEAVASEFDQLDLSDDEAPAEEKTEPNGDSSQSVEPSDEAQATDEPQEAANAEDGELDTRNEEKSDDLAREEPDEKMPAAQAADVVSEEAKSSAEGNGESEVKPSEDTSDGIETIGDEAKAEGSVNEQNQSEVAVEKEREEVDVSLSASIVFEVDEEVTDKVKCCHIRDATIDELPTADTHLYLLSLIKMDDFADEAIYRVNETSIRLTETLRMLLSLTRPLSFSC